MYLRGFLHWVKTKNITEFSKANLVGRGISVEMSKRKRCPCLVTPHTPTQTCTHTHTRTCMHACKLLKERMSVFFRCGVLLYMYWKSALASHPDLFPPVLPFKYKFTHFWNLSNDYMSFYHYCLHGIFRCYTLLLSLISGYLKTALTMGWLPVP